MWQGSSFSELDRIFLSGLLVFRNAPNVPGVEIPVSLSHWRSSEVQLVVGFSAWIVTELHLLHQCDTALGLRWSHSSHCEASTTISQLWHDEPLNTRWHLHLQRSDISLVGMILRQKPPVVRDDQWTEWVMEGPTRETSEALTLVEGPLVEVEPVELVWRLWEAERSGYPSDGGGVSSTVHVLVHLLGHLLCMAKVGGGHCHSAKHEQRDQNHHSNMLEGDSWSENWTSSALSHIF